MTVSGVSSFPGIGYITSVGSVSESQIVTSGMQQCMASLMSGLLLALLNRMIVSGGGTSLR